MTLQKFPEYMWEIYNTGGEIELGTLTIAASGGLTAQTVTMIFYRTDLFTNERFRLRFVRSNAVSTPLYSNWITPGNLITNFLITNYWIGDVRFDFSREQLNASTTVQVFLETDNYTHDYNGTQIGVVLNYINAGTGQFDSLSSNGFYTQTFKYV